MVKSVVVLDVETQYGPDDVPGGWSNTVAFKCSCVVTSTEPDIPSAFGAVSDRPDLQENSSQVNAGQAEATYRTWWEDQVPDLIRNLRRHDRVVGFNIKRFDYSVLSAYGDVSPLMAKTVDILEMIHAKLGFRISLQSLANTNFGLTKLGGGIDALKWWREGDFTSLERYCREDVRITSMLYHKILADGHLLYEDNRLGEICRLSLSIPS